MQCNPTDEQMYLHEAATVIVSLIPRQDDFEHARLRRWHSERLTYVRDTGMERLEQLSALSSSGPMHMAPAPW